jgi:hypothetical protein
MVTAGPVGPKIVTATQKERHTQVIDSRIPREADMLTVDLKQPATVVVLPRETRDGSVLTASKNLSVANAIRYVMEKLPKEERMRAVVQTASRSLFFLEIEAVYDHPSFPRAHETAA